MRLVPSALVLIVLATAGCAGHRQPPAQPTFRFEHLCDDARFSTMCSPVLPPAGQRPIQVDTNMSPPAVRASRLG